MIDETMNSEDNHDYAYTKPCRKSGAIKQCGTFISLKIRLLIYKSLLLLLLDYYDIVYMQTNQQTLQKLPILQNVARRVDLPAIPHDHF